MSEDGGGAAKHDGHVVTFNVGGTRFETTLGTIARADYGGLLHQIATALREETMRANANQPSAFLAKLAKLKLGYSNQAEEKGGAVFLDRNPRAFEVVLDFLRTGRVMCGGGVLREQVDEEFRYYGIETKGTRLRIEAKRALTVGYGKHIDSFVEIANHAVERGAAQGRGRVTLGLVSKPYGIGIEAEESEEACRQLKDLFDVARISDELVQVMCILDCRWEAALRLLEDGIFLEGGYNKGDVYGDLVPVHVFFAVGLEQSLVAAAAKDLEATIRAWKPVLVSRDQR